LRGPHGTMLGQKDPLTRRCVTERGPE